MKKEERDEIRKQARICGGMADALESVQAKAEEIAEDFKTEAQVRGTGRNSHWRPSPIKGTVAIRKNVEEAARLLRESVGDLRAVRDERLTAASAQGRVEGQ